MEVHCKWRRIDRAIYMNLVLYMHGMSKVFATSTDIDGVQPFNMSGKPYIMTEWGFSDSDVPLIRYEKVGDEERFFISSVSIIED